VRVLAASAMNTFGSNRHRPREAWVTLSAQRFTILGSAFIGPDVGGTHAKD
jgi:hypothetical protein